MAPISAPSAATAAGRQESLALPAPVYHAPFFNIAYLMTIHENATERVRTRFIAETLKHYDTDKKSSLAVSELVVLTQDLHKILGLPSPKQSHAADVCKRALGKACLENDTINREDFETWLFSLLKGALFKLKIAGAESRSLVAQTSSHSSSGQLVARSGVPAPLPEVVPSECARFPIDAQVMVMSFQRCYVKYGVGAKRLGLKSFKADQFPPRSGLTVCGSFQFKGQLSSKEIIPFDTYIVGVVDENGKGYLVDSEGLQASDQQVSDTKGNARARTEAIALGTCLTVRKRLQEFSNGTIVFRKST